MIVRGSAVEWPVQIEVVSADLVDGFNGVAVQCFGLMKDYVRVGQGSGWICS